MGEALKNILMFGQVYKKHENSVLFVDVIRCGVCHGNGHDRIPSLTRPIIHEKRKNVTCECLFYTYSGFYPEKGTQKLVIKGF
jgi:hypothetical protein